MAHQAQQGAMKTFWAARAVATQAADVKRMHSDDRATDHKLRWRVRADVRKDGVTSNLYPMDLLGDGEVPAILYRYELSVTRKSRPAAPDAAAGGGRRAGNGIVSSTRAWRVFTQSMSRYPNIPPLVRVQNRIYSTNPLPPQMTELPKENLDLGWESCRLAPIDRVDLKALPPAELRLVLNKILPWALSFHTGNNGTFTMVREVDGKMVCTEDGISTAGLRIFKGTIAQVLHLNPTSAHGPGGAKNLSSARADPKVPETRTMITLQPGSTVSQMFEVRVIEFLKEFTYQSQLVQTYLVADASGTTILTLWGYAAKYLTPGTNIAVMSVRVTQSRKQQAFKAGSLPHEIHAVRSVAIIKEIDTSGEEEEDHNLLDAGDGPKLALRIDTRSTVASERSLWEEIRHHFGPGPHDEEKQRRITRAVLGTPCVMSTNLRHTQVRGVRFNITSMDDVAVDPHIREIASEFDKQQPYAVLNDYTVVPLQLLHCCFDPKMRSWQDITVAACSYLPARRALVLEKFRAALEKGMKQWHVDLKPDPFSTHSITILDDINRSNKGMPGVVDSRAAAAAQGSAVAVAGQVTTSSAAATTKNKLVTYSNPLLPGAQDRPRRLALVALTHDRCTTDDKERCVKTCKSLEKAFRAETNKAGENIVNKEDAALAFIVKRLTNVSTGQLYDRESCAIVVAPEKDTAPIRWLYGELLKRGIMPVIVRGIASEKRQKLMYGTLWTNIRGRFGLEPITGFSLYNNVPALAGKNVLMIGVDASHKQDTTTGAAVGALVTPHGCVWIPTFWKNTIRGQEVEHVAENFGYVVAKAIQMLEGMQEQKPAQGAPPLPPLHRTLDEVIVYQDGNVFSELDSMKAHVPQSCGLSFLCLHKMTNIRFVHRSEKERGKAANVTKGSVVQDLTPIAMGHKPVAPSFYQANHESDMSTTRTVQITVHHLGKTLEVSDLQQISNVLANCKCHKATKLPVVTRAAHRMAMIMEKLMASCPDLRATSIPQPLSHRAWFL